MATVYEIVQGLSQAAANAYDGALDESGEPLKAGLQREEDPILDKRVMDGFNVKFLWQHDVLFLYVRSST